MKLALDVRTLARTTTQAAASCSQTATVQMGIIIRMVTVATVAVAPTAAVQTEVEAVMAAARTSSR